MRRALVTLVLAFLMCIIDTTAAARTDIPWLKRTFESVWPTRGAQGGIFCTAFSVNQKAGLWMTAKHCTRNTPDGKWFATLGHGNPVATIVYQDPVADIAVLHSFTNTPAIRLGDAPEIGDTTIVAGFPNGIESGPAIVTFGRVSSGVVPIEVEGGVVLSYILDAQSYYGNSGSPILDARGRLIGLVWGGVPGTSYALSVPYEVVARVYRQFTAR